jgi:programmed cell death protein 5
MADNELELLRKKRLAELQNQNDAAISQQLNDQMQQRAELEQQIVALENGVKSRLTKEAAERYYNIKAANPQLAVQVLLLLAGSIERSPGSLIDDRKLKGLLERVIPKRRDIRITRK